MGENINANYLIQEDMFSLLLEDSEMLDCEYYDLNRKTNIMSVMTQLDDISSKEMEELLELLEVPYDLEFDGSYDSSPGFKKVRFEYKNNTDTSALSMIEYDLEHKYDISMSKILNAINSGEIKDIKEVKEFLLNKTRNLNTFIELQFANKPSPERMLFLSAQKNHASAFQHLYEKGISLDYKDNKTEMTTKNALSITNSETGKSRLSELIEHDNEFAAKIKKDFLKIKNQQRTKEAESSCFSL